MPLFIIEKTIFSLSYIVIIIIVIITELSIFNFLSFVFSLRGIGFSNPTEMLWTQKNRADRRRSRSLRHSPFIARQKGRRLPQPSFQVVDLTTAARKKICENEAVSIPTYGSRPITVMAVAPDFHTDFLTVEPMRPTHSPTAPSRRGGIILRSDTLYDNFLLLSRKARQKLLTNSGGSFANC